MSSFPLIKDLPPMVHVDGWTWEEFTTQDLCQKQFWLGTDPEGRRWLTKAHGSFYAYREIVFARIAQKLGWSCQSSVFGVFPASATPMKGESELVHSLHWFLQEHGKAPCSNCTQKKFDLCDIKTLKESEIKHILDLPKSIIAGYLFGANEPSDHLFTSNHEIVIIDSEQMFSTRPVPLEENPCWNDKNGNPSPLGRQLTLEVCSKLANLTNKDLREALAIPKGININIRWDIKEILFDARKYARKFIKKYRHP